MRVIGVDVETTGLDFAKDEVTEIAWVVKDWGNPRPLAIRHFYVEGSIPISPEIEALTKIDDFTRDNFGVSLDHVAFKLKEDYGQYAAEALVAHNGLMFDKPFLEAKGQDFAWLNGVQWIDTRMDLAEPKSLILLAAEHGFLNPFPHTALMDVMTMLRILDSHSKEEVMERVRSPWVTLRALVSYDDRELAKKARYFWEQAPGMTEAEKRPKCWVKRVRECHLATELKQPFEVKVL